MIDRGRIAALLLMLGAGLAVVGSFEETYRTIYRGIGPERTYTTNMWIVVSSPPSLLPENDAYYAVGWPVIAMAVLMVMAAVLLLLRRSGTVAKTVALAAAGALAGVVLTYWVQVRHEEEMMTDWPAQGGPTVQLDLLVGMYLLLAGAVIGLVGAVLAQRKQEEQPQEQEEDVVVHQLDADDDTPPFGIAIQEQDQEAR
ncbi:hypothetical protein [Lentzea terrae]|uniref:hypothetical protein n=1 Tax=Lentzea terrae TaxID=2200761 RepID=UPI00130037EB|nr:hypothetical protein [Lentzea terrae]